MTGDPGPAGLLVTEFPDWSISIRPAGLPLCGAYWQSDDGRHRRYIVAGSAGELLAELRARTGPANGVIRDHPGRVSTATERKGQE